MPSSAWVGWRGVENVYMMEPVGRVREAAKAAALLPIFYNLPPTSAVSKDTFEAAGT